MFYHVQSLINEIVADEPDPSAANALQEGPERPEQFAPGLDPELQKLADAFTEFKKTLNSSKKPTKGVSKAAKKK